MAEGGGASSLLCLAAASGLPLLCRPPRPQLPFPVIGALHGVQMFGATAGVELQAAETPRTKVVWGGYGQSITLIALSSAPDASGPALRRLLDSAFSAMVMVLGLEELASIRNVERLKRELRGCLCLLDSLLASGGRFGAPIRPLPPGPPRELLQARLQLFSSAAACGLCWLTSGGGELLLATPAVWALPPPELELLGGVLGAGLKQSSAPRARDLPIYLPHSSPSVPLRLLHLELLPGVGVALLCGPHPPLQLLQTQLVPQFWAPVGEQLQGLGRAPPQVPPQVLGYLLIDLAQGRTQSGCGRGGEEAGVLPPHRRGAALRQLQALLAPQLQGATGPAPPRLLYVSCGSHLGCALSGAPQRLLLFLLPPRTPRAQLGALGGRLLSGLGPPDPP